MPKRVTSLKPSSKPARRRGLSYSAVTGNNCNAIHLSIPLPSSSSISSVSSSLPGTSISEKTHTLASVECSARLSSPLLSSTSASSSPSSCSFASLSVTCLEMEASEGSCSASYRQVPHHDVLYEYVKGLQEANKALDVDVAERVMQELAESMTSPAAAAMVVSSGGAHLIASAVKQFKAYGMQKATANKAKSLKVGAGSKSSSVLKLETKAEVGVPLQGKSHSACISSTPEPNHQQRGDPNDLPSIKEVRQDEGQPPNAVPTSNEARRKRQRTSDELLEFEDYRSECHCKGNSEMYTISSFAGDTRTCATASSASKCASEFPSLSTGNHQDADDCTGSYKSKAMCSKWVELVKSKVKGPKQRDSRCSEVSERVIRCEKVDDITAVHSGSRHMDADDVFVNMSKKFGDVSRTLLEAMVDEVCESRSNSSRNAELEATIMNRLQGMVAASVQSLPLGSSSQCKVVLTKQKDFLNKSKPSAKAWCATVKEKNKGKSLPIFSNGDASDFKQKKSSMSAERIGPLKNLGGQLSNTETAFDNSQRAEHQSKGGLKQHSDPFRSSKGCQQKQASTIGLESSTRDKKGIVCGEECKLHDNASTCKAKDEGKTAPSNVLQLAKEAGLPDVVAAACHALDKLINAALQGRNVPVGNNTVIVTHPPGRRRGKVLPAELYVALTEALVEIVQVLKDQVDLLCWCLDCLGSILPPTSLNRSAYDGLSSSACSALDSFFSSKDLLHANGCKGKKADDGASVKQAVCDHNNLQSSALSAISSTTPCSVEIPPKSTPKSSSGVSNLDTALSACDNGCSSTTKSAIGLGPSFCGSISSGSASSSISALAAVAYTATVPMLAEKAVKAILSAIQPCDIEPQSTQAALHALSAHLSSTNSKYVCDDVITFIIAAMREFKSDAEMQTESCITLSSLNRAISSATGHCAWSTIMDTMNTHHTNIVVQRAGCSALHVLCTRAGLGVLEWGSGKRPERAGKDSDRESGVEALVSAMLLFPDDVRIQWHGCSALWTLVHSAGTRSVANMVCNGALCAVIGAMRVCRTNEVMQQEGCNVIGTMARMLVESGFGFGSQSTLDVTESPTMHKSTDRCRDGSKNLNRTVMTDKRDRFLGLSEEWWEALKVVVTAMKAFRKSKSVQSNGIFALGCILKGSMDMGSTLSTVASVPDTNLGSSDLYLPSSKASTCGNDTLRGDEERKRLLSLSRASSYLKQPEDEQAETTTCLGMGALEEIGRLNEAVEVTMVAMPEFPKVETIQVWGCAVLQQVFLAYVHYSKRAMSISPTGSISGSSQGGKSHKSAPQVTRGVEVPSHPNALANLVLSQATSTMFMISGMMALSYNGSAASGDPQGLEKSTVCCDSKVSTKPATNKSTGLRSQSSQTNQSLTSVRQSWCAALGAIGDVFGHLTQNTETSASKSLPKMANAFDITAMIKSFDSSNAETPVSNRKDAELTAKLNDQSQNLENGLLDGKTGLLSVEFPTSNRQFSSSHTVKQNGPTTGTDRLVNVPSSRHVRASEDTSLKSKSAKQGSSSCIRPEIQEQVLSKSEWCGKDGISQQQVINDIKAWQEATESLAKIAERVGFPMSVKNAILAIRTILYKLEDPETVIWACHALVSLYLTWENVHLFKPGLENNREEYKAKMWGEGDVGVRQLVYLVSHWTKQSRTDVTSLALQALYSACVFAATVREIEEVFAPSDCGIEAVLGAMQKVLASGGSLSQRRKVVQQACCVLAEVCGYSIPVQIGFAAAGGADVILSALDRFDEDNDVLVNGLHALGLDSRLQADFDVLWNAAINKSGSSNGSRGSRRKKGGSTSIVSLCHVFKEGTVASSSVTLNSLDGKGVPEVASFDSERLGLRYSPQLERLVFDGTTRIGRFLTWLVAGPGCGGPAFCAEVLRRLNSMPQKQPDMQSRVCLIIRHMSTHNSKWREEFLGSGGFEAVLACTEGFHFSGGEKVRRLPMCVNGVEKMLFFELPDAEKKSAHGKMKTVSRQKKNGENKYPESGMADSLHNHVQYAACIALTGLIGDQQISNPSPINVVIKALVLALHHYGGLSHLDLHLSRVEKVQLEVCASARLALARLGVSWIGDSQSKHLAHEAAEAGDFMSLEALAQNSVDITAMDGSGCTPLWYAEQSGQAKTAQFLKEQEQHSGRRRARDKSKVKCKRGLSTGDPQPADAQIIDELQVSQGLLDVSQLAEEGGFERKLQVLQERNSHQTQFGASEQAAKETLRNTCSKENFMSEADSRNTTVSQELEAYGTLKKNIVALLSCPVIADPAGPEIEGKKYAHKKKNKGSRKSQAIQQSLEDNFAASPSPESPTVVCDEAIDDSANEVVDHATGVKNEQALNAGSMRASGDGVEESIDDAPFVPSTAKNNGSGHANQLLHQALVSGVVENLEAALQSCEDPESGADDILLKKVRAALAKRLKRAEKSVALEKELSAAVEERSCSRLLAAIVAVENVPRFAAVFSEKLISARNLLLEIQSEERAVEIVDIQKSSVSGSAAKAGTVQKSSVSGSAAKAGTVHVLRSNDEGGICGGPHLLKESVKLRGKKDGEGVVGFWKEFSGAQVMAEGKKHGIKRQGIMTDRRGDSSSLEVTLNDCSHVRNECQMDGGGSGNPKGPIQTQNVPKSQASSIYQRHEIGKISRNVVSCSSGSTQPLGPVSFLQEKPPLLPTPQAPDNTLPPIELNTCSVIQPPRPRDQPVKSLEHNPITPQLFPASQGAPFGYTYGEVVRGKYDLSDGCSSSSKDMTSQESELGPFHISQLFPSCSPPQLFSSTSDSLCYNSWPLDYLSEPGASVQNFGSSLSNVQPTHLTGDFVPSSTTLFSSTFGENHQFSSSSAFTSSCYDSLPLPLSQTHSPLFAGASESNVGSLPTFVQQALSCTCDDDFGEEQQGSAKKSSWMPSSALCFPGEVRENLIAYKQSQPSGLPAEVACKENTVQLSTVNQDFQHLSQFLLQQATLSDASIGASCCVCFDRPKETTLISCGHQMCKGCAEQMHRLHHLCPVCNRMIETVLSLCT